MIKIYKTDKDGILKELKQLEKGSWIELVNPTEEELHFISKEAQISPKMIQKVLDDEELPRIESDKQATLVVTDYPFVSDYGKKNKFKTLPVGMIITHTDYFITVSLKKLPITDLFIEGRVKEFYTDKKTRFVVQFLSCVANAYLRELKLINKELESKEKILVKATNNSELLNLLNIEKSLVYFITSLKANEIVLEKLKKGEILPLYEEDLELIEDAIIENRQGIENANIYREILTSTSNTYGTIVSNNLNQIMKFLAGITIVFSIPTMIASFMGMNVPLGIFEKNPYSFIILIVVSFLLSLIIAYILKKKDML